MFKRVSDERGVEYFATNDISLAMSDVERIYSRCWKVEEYHQGLKQQCGAAKCQARKQRSLRNHIWCSIHAFVSLEMHRIQFGITWQEAKLSIAREAIYKYLLAPRFDFAFSTA